VKGEMGKGASLDIGNSGRAVGEDLRRRADLLNFYNQGLLVTIEFFYNTFNL